jgi:transcription elongation factor GreA
MPDAFEDIKDSTSDAADGVTFLLTAHGHALLKAELQVLQVEKRRDIAERIRESKDHGEFSEDNSELDEVKQEQAIVENRIAELKAILSGAEILNEDDVPTDRVGLGSRVHVKDDERGIDFTIRIVHAVEANPDDDLVSSESPMGQALMGSKPGEVVSFEAPAGRLQYEILKISK